MQIAAKALLRKHHGIYKAYGCGTKDMDRIYICMKLHQNNGEKV